MVNLVHYVLNLVKFIEEIRKAQREESKKALNIADHLSDLILFHKMVRENGTF